MMAADYKPSKFGWENGKFVFKHVDYDNLYPRLMERYRTKTFRMLEIGLDSGAGSLLWREYFPCAELYGIEKETTATHTKGAETIHTFQGDQADKEWLHKFIEQSGGKCDLIVDDGGHHGEMQMNSYEVLFEHALNPGGTYIIEDIETSFWKQGTPLYGKPIQSGGFAAKG